MQRIACILLGLSGPALAAQATAGTQLWRLASTTVPVPPALATGGVAAFWNPAQPDGASRAVFGLDAIETPAAIGASGLLATVRVRAGGLGRIGAVYGRMGIGDLTRTTTSPTPDAGTIPYFTEVFGASWAKDAGAATIGATLAFHHTALDQQQDRRWTLDIGAQRPFGDRLRLAAATHFFSSWTSGDPSQDLYGGAELLMWRGALWTDGPPASLFARYGIALAHGFDPDHLIGGGVAVGDLLSVDLMLAREGSFGIPGWRPVGGVRVLVGKYRVSFARDVGVHDIGSAFRVGIEARVR